MKRDMELVRQILSKVEQADSLGEQIHLEIEGYSQKEISHHIRILSEAGLINEIHSLGSFIDWWAESLTWQGHEFLAASRDDKIWRKALEKLGDKAGSIPFSVLQQLLIKLAAASFGLDA